MDLSGRLGERADWLAEHGYCTRGDGAGSGDLYWTKKGYDLIMSSNRDLIDYKYGKNRHIVDVLYGLAHDGALTKFSDMLDENGNPVQDLG